MRKILLSTIALILAFTTVAVFLPTSAASQVLPASSVAFSVKSSCTTNASGYCTVAHNLGVVPTAVQAQAINYIAITTTRNWTATSVQVRLAKRINSSNNVDPWANITVQLTLVGTYIPGSTPSPSVSATPSVSPSASVTPSTSVSPSTPPVASDYPTATNTGVPAGTVLTNSAGMVVSTANTVIDGKRISGDVDIRASGVMIKNSEISGRVINDNVNSAPSFTIEDSQVGSDTGCSTATNGAVGTQNYTALRVKLVGYVDGFRIGGDNVLIQDSFVKLCGTNPDYHSDGIQAYGAGAAQNIVIKHNVIDQRAVIGEAQTAPIFIPNDNAGQGNQGIRVIVDDNVLAAGSYSLRVFGSLPFSAPSISGNKIVDGTWGYGPVDVECSRITSWSSNAVVTYDWTAGKILTQVRSLDAECPPTAFPNAANTGVPTGTNLTAQACTGDTLVVTTDNTVLNSKTINCNVEVRAKNVVISKSKVTGSVYTPDGNLDYSFRVEDSEITFPTIDNWGRTMVGEANFTLLRSEVTGGNRGVYCRKNCTVQDSWIHGTKVIDAMHASAIRVSQGAKLIHNTIHCDVPDSGEAGCSANMTGYPDFESVKNNTVERNLFKATPGGYCAYGGATKTKPYSNAADNATNIVFKDNVFEKGTSSGKCGWWGPITDFDDSRPGNIWSGNKWDDGVVVNP